RAEDLERASRRGFLSRCRRSRVYARSNPSFFLKLLQVSNDASFRQAVHCRLNIGVDTTHNSRRFADAAGPGSEDITLAVKTVIDVFLDSRLCICQHGSVRGK